jgi:hypothetical protein
MPTDLPEIQAAQAVKLVGADAATGNETNYHQVDKLNRAAVYSKGAPTFVAFASAVAPAANKSMISILNTEANKVVRISKMFLINTQTGAVTGVVNIFQWLRMTGHSLGTAITPQSKDTADTIPSGITVRTGGTIAGEVAAILEQWKWSSDEWGAGALDTEANDHAFQQSIPLLDRKPDEKPWTLRTNQGFTLKQTVGTTVGTFDIALFFTVEDE